MDLLRATGGILATDSYEFVTPIFIGDDFFALDFFVAGWRYYDGERVIDQLQVGDNVNFVLDYDNKEDDKAILVKSVNGDMLGYIPAFYSGWMSEVIEKNVTLKQNLQLSTPHAVPHRKVSISIVGEVNNFIDIQEVLMDKDELLLVM